MSEEGRKEGALLTRPLVKAVYLQGLVGISPKDLTANISDLRRQKEKAGV